MTTLDRVLVAKQTALSRVQVAVFVPTVALTLIGLLMVYSASFAIGLYDYGNVNYFITRQVMFAVPGAALLLIFMRIDYQRLRWLSPLILLIALAALLAVLVPGIGVASNGAQRWIRLGPLPPVQPSEFAKLALIIYVAHWLASKGERVKSFWLGVVPFVLTVALVGGLVLLQPDLGTGLVVVFVCGAMLWVGGARIQHALILATATLLSVALYVAVEGYRVDRIYSFLHAEHDPGGRGYQIVQLLIALGSGGIRGLGLGASRQKFLYVPGAQTDGIFAIIGEELGLIGAVAVLLLFAVLIGGGLMVAVRCKHDSFGALLAVGITSWIAFQALVNIAGVTRSLPLTGIPLPFMSYGGSALCAELAGIGVLLSICRNAPTAPPIPPPPVRPRPRPQRARR